MRMEIRCCCDARLIGWVDVDRELQRGEPVAFLICESLGTTLRDGVEATVTADFEVLRFTAARIGGINRYSAVMPYLALKSDHYPIEKLRRIPSFIEAREKDDE